MAVHKGASLLLLPWLLAVPNSALRAGASGGGSAKRGRLAVVVSGLQERLLWRSKVERVVAPTVRAGHSVDVYLEVVASGASGRRFATADPKGQVRSPEADVENLGSALAQSITNAGGRLAHFRVRQELEELSLPAGEAAERLPKHLFQYSPLTDPLGKNVLRRYQTTERLANLSAASGEEYDFVLWTRDDDHWLGPLDLGRFLADSKAPWRMYSKACLRFNGINDKTLLFGREAAKAMLGRLYTDFWLPEKSLEVQNAERFVEAFALVKGVESVPVPFGQLPTADSVFVRAAPGAEARLCQKDRYLCALGPPGLPSGQGFERPSPCGTQGSGESAAEVQNETSDRGRGKNETERAA